MMLTRRILKRSRIAAVLAKLRPGDRRMAGSHEEIFSDIYRRRVWASPETVSGPGSTRERAATFRGDLVTLLAQLDVHVLLDAGCGDFNWTVDVVDSVERYIGIDVVPDLIADNVRMHGRPGRTFLCRDITRAPLPKADLILCRDCLVHFSFADIEATVRNFARSGSRYLLTTTFLDTAYNTDVETGGWRALNLQQPPFSFPPPQALVDERCLHSQGRYRGKRFALWALDSLPS